ncbi:MAG: Ig-like domain-containing protein, partial [Candidatus Thorarchaeota archaeon]
DSHGAGSSARVYITVIPVNDAPEAYDDAYAIDEDIALQLDPAGGVITNDVDIDGDPLQAVLVSGPSNGLLILNADGSLTYTPNTDFWGTDSFMYYVTDGFLSSNTAIVTITINAVNDAPVAVDDTYTTDEDIPLTVFAPGLLANDYDIEGDALSAILVDAPLHGSVVLDADGFLHYIPDPDWWGVDTLTYQAFDGTVYSTTATVTITVNYVNTPPTANDDAFTTEAGVLLIVAAPGVLANDVDIDEDPLEANLFEGPMFGILIFNADGSFTYTPAADWCGVDEFSYIAFDGREYSDVAVVTITVIDVMPPVTTIQFTGVEGEYGWYHSDVEVTLSTVYSLDGATWMLYTDPFILSDPGEVTVYFYSTDNAGNVEDVKTATIKIGKPTRSFVTGGGWICDSGGKGHFGFVVKYKRGVLKGHLIYIFRDDGHKYIIKSTDWFGMAIDGNHALLEGKAKILRYNYETKKWECFRTFYFRVEVWDNGKGNEDVFQIRIFDESSDLFHEAGFDPIGELQGGNIRIHHRGPKYTCWCLSKKKWH